MTLNNLNELVLKAIGVLESLESGNPEAITNYINPDKYIQHNQALSDGDYVANHSVYVFFGHKIGFDIFHFENGLIVEQWDNLPDMLEKTPSNHTMIDGPDTIKDIDKTDSNKVYVKSYVENILVGKNPGLLTSCIPLSTICSAWRMEISPSIGT